MKNAMYYNIWEGLQMKLKYLKHVFSYHYDNHDIKFLRARKKSVTNNSSWMKAVYDILSKIAFLMKYSRCDDIEQTKDYMAKKPYSAKLTSCPYFCIDYISKIIYILSSDIIMDE